MEIFVIHVIWAALFALIGRNRKIGYWWGFALCLFITPIIGLIIILWSKKEKKPSNFVDITQDNQKNIEQ